MDNPGWIAIVLKWFRENKSIEDSSGVRERERVFTLLSSQATLLYYLCDCVCVCVLFYCEGRRSLGRRSLLKKKEVYERNYKLV